MTPTFHDPQQALDHILFWDREDVHSLKTAVEYVRDRGGELAHFLDGALAQIRQLASFQAKTITNLFHGDCFAVDIHGNVLAGELQDLKVYSIKFVLEE